ncbi:MAG: hypothetical protein ACREQN_04020 [Candidatus Binataceae bacterium]
MRESPIAIVELSSSVDDLKSRVAATTASERSSPFYGKCLIATGKVSDACWLPTVTVAVTRAMLVGCSGVKVKVSLLSAWQRSPAVYENVATPPRSKGLVAVSPEPLAGFRLKSCELYVRVIEPPSVHAGFGCSTVTVKAAGVPTVRDVTGELVELFHPQPPEPSSPCGPCGGASMQRDWMHELQLSFVAGG